MDTEILRGVPRVGQLLATPIVTFARAWATVVALIGVVAVILGVRSLSRARRDAPTQPITPLVLGAVALIGGIVNLAVADGGPGTGNGVVAGGAAIVTGLASLISVGVAVRARAAR